MSKKTTNTREIVSLSDFEHALIRPTILIGSVQPSEQHVPIVEDGLIMNKQKTLSVGFYKLLNEIVDNAFDEARRCNGKMKEITVSIYSKTNMVIVSDTGEGFYKPNEIHPKTKLTNVETAFTQLKAGSNFYNEDSDDETLAGVVGTNGIGASVVNMFSDYFEVTTCDGKKKYMQKWEQFVSKRKLYTDEKCKGTTVSFIPRKDKFPECTWDKDIIHTMFLFKNYLKKNDSVIQNVKFSVKFDNVDLDLEQKFLPEDSVVINTKLGMVCIYPNYQGTANISFVNMAMCEGSHQNVIHDWLNTVIKDDKAHNFYRTFIFLNLEPKYVVFGNQNKTKFDTTRKVIEPVLKDVFLPKIKTVFGKSELIETIRKSIKDKQFESQLKKLDKVKSSKITLSNKYFPSAKTKDILFLVEGQSAVGSLNQKRDINTMSSYALKGKLKNLKQMSDLINNEEVSELIKILGLDISGEKKPKYNKIVIAADSDVDGMHVSSLILNFFYSWFPHIVKEGYLYQLQTPLVSVTEGKKKVYFYSMEEYNKVKGKKEYKNFKYYKGLGSLNQHDWVQVFDDLKLTKFIIDPDAKKNIDMAFNDDSDSRKEWLAV